MKWKIKDFFYRVKNLIRWFPVIWKDYDYDYVFLYTVMQTKIRNMRLLHEKNNRYVDSHIEIKWMKVCEKLLQALIVSEYWKDKYDNIHLNLKTIDAPQWEKNLCVNNIAQEDEGFWKKGYDFGIGHRAELREIKARHLLFKILSWRIPYWWD